jgi:nitroreductase
MSTMNSTIEQAFRWRYATKRYDPTRKISDADWKTLKDALVMSPSSYGMQPWKFIWVQDPAVREKLRPVSWNQEQVTTASHYVVFTSTEKTSDEDVSRYIKRIAEVRGVSVDSLKGFQDMLHKNLVLGTGDIHWSQRQAYIAMGFLLQTAALLKIDATPIEGLDPEAYDQILSLKGSGWKTVAAVALGYRHPEDKYQSLPKVRFPEHEVIVKI